MANRAFNGLLLRKVGRQKLIDLINQGKLDCGALIPAYRGGEEWLFKKKEQALIIAEDKTPPNAKLRALYWAILGMVCSNHTFYISSDELNEHIKKELRYFKFFTDHKLQYNVVLKSNSDIEGNWDEFKEYFDRAMDYIVAEIFPGITKRTIIQEIEKAIGGPTYKDAIRGNRGKDTGEMYGDNDDDLADERNTGA